jgi:hypothetical protein
MRSDDSKGPAGDPATTPRRVHLPGFLSEQDIGLGDAIKRTTSYFGIRPCGGCERRATALNNRFVFSGRGST